MAYDFDDNNTTENRTHTNGITTQSYNQRKVYDELARFHDYNIAIGGPENLAARYEYNYRNELIENNQHWGGSAWLQSIDYAYNDQGWLTTINSPTLGGTNIAFPTCTSSVVNPGTTTVGQDIDTKDLFYMQLQYDVLHSGLSGTLRKDGNIAQAIWRVRGRQRQAYSYSYDGLQRISAATYSDINDAGTVTASNRYNTSYTYADLRGNISNLQRNGLYLSGGCYTQALMDNLTYTHTSGTNKISSITDAAMSAQGGFRAASGGYTYDANGNMLTNGAKGITSISYNHLNLPTNITITGGKTIDFTYAADGTKLRKVVKTGAAINLVMEYVSGIEYRGTAIPATTLEAVYFAEGRLYNNSGTWKREYVIKDHLGNTRIAYCDINGDGVIAVPGEILQENNYDAFGYGSDGVYMNHANADNLYQYNGKELNIDHGLNMYDYGARWYDAGVGRFSSVDALADHPNQSDKSPYAYAWNNPVNLTDPDGNCPRCIKAAIKTVVKSIAKGKVDLGEFYDIAESVGTLVDGNLNMADAEAIFNLLSPVSTKDIKAGKKLLEANKAVGKKAEKLVTSDLKKEFPDDNVLEEVTGKYADGTTTRFDNVVIDAKTGKPKVMNETKAGGATHSKQQSRFHKDGESATLTGKNAGSAAGTEVNKSTTETRTTRVKRDD